MRKAKRKNVLDDSEKNRKYINECSTSELVLILLYCVGMEW